MKRTISIFICFSATLFIMDFIDTIEFIRSQHITGIFNITLRFASILGLFSLVVKSVMILGHLGLFLSPLVKEKNLYLRLLVITSMVPFIYLWIAPNIIESIMLIFARSSEGWKYNYKDYLGLIVSSVTLGGIYSFTVISLLKSKQSSERRLESA